jgi:hypothetical protein
MNLLNVFSQHSKLIFTLGYNSFLKCTSKLTCLQVSEYRTLLNKFIEILRSISGHITVSPSFAKFFINLFILYSFLENI